MSLGLYISVPFCRTKCTYCNFASDVFSRAAFERYVNRVCSDIEHAAETAGRMGGDFERAVDSVYLGGGTPTILDVTQVERIFVAVSQNFEVAEQSEITVECAPATLNPGLVETLQRHGVNRVSLGVQSFVDQESRSVGRVHNRTAVLDDIKRLRAAGIANLSIDLIAGLPHQTAESWEFSLNEVLACEAPHCSVYMLEVDGDSRLGRELMAGGTKYHAHFVPDDDLTADFYLAACERLESAGIRQYEISNFAGAGFESRHNLKYWTRQPYFGFGVDAHSMLPIKMEGAHQAPESNAAIRFATPDSLDSYLTSNELRPTPVSQQDAMAEAFFLGLRLNRGIELSALVNEFGGISVACFRNVIADLIREGLLEEAAGSIRLTARGRLLSNEVFERFLTLPAA